MPRFDPTEFGRLLARLNPQELLSKQTSIRKDIQCTAEVRHVPVEFL